MEKRHKSSTLPIFGIFMTIVTMVIWHSVALILKGLVWITTMLRGVIRHTINSDPLFSIKNQVFSMQQGNFFVNMYSSVFQLEQVTSWLKQFTKKDVFLVTVFYVDTLVIESQVWRVWMLAVQNPE